MEKFKKYTCMTIFNSLKKSWEHFYNILKGSCFIKHFKMETLVGYITFFFIFNNFFQMKHIKEEKIYNLCFSITYLCFINFTRMPYDL